MKRKRNVALVFVVLIILTACSGSRVSIDNNKIEKSTIALNKDGKIEMGIVEDFSKNYQNLDELETFIQDSIMEFCAENGEKAVNLEYLKKKNDKVHATLAFDSINSYVAFNDEKVSFMKLSEAMDAGLMPDEVENINKSGAVQVSALNAEEYYVAIWKGDYQLLVEGKIAYYLNGVILNDNTIQISTEDSTIVIF